MQAETPKTVNGSPDGTPDRERSAGALYALLAYGVWGVAPIYWKATRFVPPAELLAYRVLWSFAVALVLEIGRAHV